MINLIPQTAKRKITLEYWLRVVSVWMMILTGITIIATLLLFPVYVLVNSKVAAYETSAMEAKSSVSEYDVSASALIDASVQARLLLDLADQQNFSALVVKIDSLKNENITIENFGFSRTATGVAPIEVIGKAKTRQALADFRETLLGDPAIEKVFLPISNLAQDRDIEFNVTITMKESDT